MIETDLKASSGGGTEIRETKSFCSSTPRDYTNVDGQRYLIKGDVETDDSKFDTEIWNELDIVTTRALVGYRTGDNLNLSRGVVGANANEIWWFTTKDTLGKTYAPSISVDGGLNYSTPSVLIDPEINTSDSCLPIFSQGWMICGSKSSATISRSNDLAQSWEEIDTGLPGNVLGMIGNGDAIVVWSNSGKARRSVNGGASWSDVDTLIGSNTFRQPTVLNNLWVIINNSADVWTSNDLGLTWTYGSNKLPTGVVSFISDGTKMYSPSHSSDYPVKLWESTDGMVWLDSGIQTDDSGDYIQRTTTVGERALKLGGANGMWVSNAGYVSRDGLNWKDWSVKYTGDTLTYLAIVKTPTGCSMSPANGVIYDMIYSLYAGDLIPIPLDETKQEWVRLT